MTRILIVEDNQALSRMLGHNLQLEGYAVAVAGNGGLALDLCRRGEIDLVLLDLMIPYPDGVTVLKTLREDGNQVPVIVLTAKGESNDKLRGLRLGADDYVTKPFDLVELLARIAAVLRRTSRAPIYGSNSEPTVLAVGPIRIDLSTRAVEREGEPVHLRPKEYELLVALARRNGVLAKRSELLAEVWGYHPGVISRTLDTHIGELRRKLELDPTRPRLIVTVRKAGFRLAMSVGTLLRHRPGAPNT